MYQIRSNQSKIPGGLTYPNVDGEADGKDGGKDDDAPSPELVVGLICPICDRLPEEYPTTLISHNERAWGLCQRAATHARKVSTGIWANMTVSENF